jgi:hypothetical protein
MKPVYLLMIVFLLPISLDFSAARVTFRPASLATTATVTVTNATDVMNGDISGIAALIANPGPDGISFREAIGASNNTIGLKTIEFAPDLKGAIITLGSEGTVWALFLTSGQLTINGDVDGDGKPDITLDGSLGATNSMGSGFSIWSSHNTIKSLILDGFYLTASIRPLQDFTLLKTVIGNQFIGNVISSTLPGAAGITFGMTGSGDDSSDYSIQDTLIINNTFSGQDWAVGIVAGSGGASRNQVINTTIANNHLTGGCICIGAGDVASDWGGVPGPIQYSDNNLIDHLAIVNNVLEDGAYMSLGAANLGNRYNQVNHVQISNNTLLRTNGVGIIMLVGTNGGKERSTRFNAMSDIDIDHNTITGTLTFAIWAGVGCALAGPTPEYPLYAGVEDSQLNRMRITDNDIENYHEAGIRISGGCEVPGTLYAANNILDQLTISGNKIIHTDPNDYDAVGIELRGGESSGGPAQGNIIQGATVFSNTVSGNDIGISLVGGKGTGAQANRVVVAVMQANDLAGNTEQVQIFENIEGAMGNFVDLPCKIYLPLIEQNN